mmetsp:Transcript_454/g.613  ORF Transcript_454/g.613 Transcript_454/m.613 type:complete len:152 (-) Transcript_454:84-539(-)
MLVEGKLRVYDLFPRRNFTSLRFHMPPIQQGTPPYVVLEEIHRELNLVDAVELLALEDKLTGKLTWSPEKPYAKIEAQNIEQLEGIWNTSAAYNRLRPNIVNKIIIEAPAGAIWSSEAIALLEGENIYGIAWTIREDGSNGQSEIEAEYKD